MRGKTFGVGAGRYWDYTRADGTPLRLTDRVPPCEPATGPVDNLTTEP
jgi:hypothetical protein